MCIRRISTSRRN